MIESFFSTILSVIFYVFIIEVACSFFFGWSPLRFLKAALDSYVEKNKKKKRKPRVRVQIGKVFHVGAMDGRNAIVHAQTEHEAKLIASKSLSIEPDDLVAEEVYENVLRK